LWGRPAKVEDEELKEEGREEGREERQGLSSIFPSPPPAAAAAAAAPPPPPPVVSTEGACARP